jgi:hypothetical protein
MAHGDPKIPKSVRLLPGQAQYIGYLMDVGAFGTKESDIIRMLIQRGIDQLVDSRYIKNYLEDKELSTKAKGG